MPEQIRPGHEGPASYCQTDFYAFLLPVKDPPTRAHVRLRRFLLFSALALAGIGVLIGLYGWRAGWFSGPPPMQPFSEEARELLEDVFEKASSGNYEEALHHVDSPQREFLSENTDLAKATWDRITKNGTISKVVVKRQVRGVTLITVEFELCYRDGSKTDVVKEWINWKGGRWQLGFIETVKTAAPEFYPAKGKADYVRLQVAASQVTLEDQYTAIPGTDARIRLPRGCVWNDGEKAFINDKFGITVGGVQRSGKMDQVLAHADNTWLKRGWTLQKKEDVTIEVRSGTLYEGQLMNKGFPFRLMHLFLGESGVFLELTASWTPSFFLDRLVHDCALSVKWSPTKQDGPR